DHAICTPSYQNTRPLDAISAISSTRPNLRVTCTSSNNKRLTHFSTCKVYGTIIRSVLPKDHP
ncbi:unnamed protein product, partial [Musa hybrid cultivar]